jgi:hypothetical protein
MAYERIKPEMKGTGSRCIPRADAKKASDRLRREADKRECAEGEESPVQSLDDKTPER